MKAKKGQFKEPYPAKPLEKGEKGEYESQSHHSPVNRWVTMWNDEVKRESNTHKLVKSGKSIQDLDREYKEAEKNRKPWEDNSATVEVSGDALARARRGEPAKDTVDVKKGFN